MSFTSVKLKWATKLLKAKYFVILTDTESAIALKGANPQKFHDAIALAGQASELHMFHHDLGKLIEDHDDKLAELAGDNVEQKPTSSPKKIQVTDSGATKKPSVRPRKDPVRADANKKV